MISADRPAVLFDLDGTLVDTALDLTAALNHVLEVAGRRPVDPTSVRAMVGRGGRVLIERGMAATGDVVDERTLDTYVSHFLSYYDENIATNSAPFPGAVDMLESLRNEGWMLAVCTNKPEALSLKLLEKLEMLTLFERVAGADTYAFRKPDPRHATMILNEFETPTSKALFVGDSAPDVLAAKAANIPVAVMSFGYSVEPIDELGADVILDHLSQVPAWCRSFTAAN